MPETPTHAPPVVCPECRSGKHVNCTTLALDADDQYQPCACECGGGLHAWVPDL